MGGQSAADTASFLGSIGAPDSLRATFDKPEEVDVFPDNWLPVRVFCLLSTQWRLGHTGPTGLDYSAIPAVMDMAGVKPKRRPDTFWAVREMELESLDVMAKRNG
jgi:hypothetical protein